MMVFIEELPAQHQWRSHWDLMMVSWSELSTRFFVWLYCTIVNLHEW